MAPAIWVIYVGEKRRTLGKGYGLKGGAIGNTLGEHIQNFRNNVGNTLKCWEHH
jgi:hypothetical protein